MKTALRTAVACSALLATGCFGPVHNLDARLDNVLQKREAYVAALRHEQKLMDWDNTEPREKQFPGAGTVTVERWRVEGIAGYEYLWLHFTYDNTTKDTFDRARVFVKVHEPDGRVVGFEWVDMRIPYFHFHPGSSYTTDIFVPTHGAHWKNGWYWTIGCIANKEGFKRPLDDMHVDAKFASFVPR